MSRMESILTTCEANTSLPQYIDIDDLRKFDEPYRATIEQDLKTMEVKQTYLDIQTDYNVLPTFNRRYDYLNSILSLKDNKYLSCKWYQFLEKVPETFITVKLYPDIIKSKTKSRRLNLNGQFYGVDNKLAPIPVGPDPRKYKHEHLNYGRKECPLNRKQVRKNTILNSNSVPIN